MRQAGVTPDKHDKIHHTVASVELGTRVGHREDTHNKVRTPI